MNKIKVIKTEKDYEEALEMMGVLMSTSPDPNSDDGEKLNLLATLIEDYESNIFPESLPDPIDAILFRMEQENLKPVDLIPFIGSKSKVSEVLARKRPLTLSMMRSLESGLGIPAKVLLKETDKLRDPENISWIDFPVKEMEKRGYFTGISIKNIGLEKMMESFFKPIGSPSFAMGLTRKTDYVRASRPMSKQSLLVWSCQILKKGLEIKYPTTFKKGVIDIAFMQKLAKLSALDDGPLKAMDLLKSIGVGVVIEPHFPKTYLDGVAIMSNKDHPVIGLTLRHDRLDNFWFTLMHEVSHVALHYDTEINLFYDDLESKDSNIIEDEADKLAGESLIPRSKWENSPARLIPSEMAAESLALELGIHPAIVAGKMRYEGNNYQYLNTIVTKEKVRTYFPEVTWK